MTYSELRNTLKSAILDGVHFLDYKLTLNPNGFSLSKHNEHEYFAFWGNTRKYSEVFFIDYLHCGIGYKIIEDLLIPILVKYSFLGSGALIMPSYSIGIEKEFPLVTPGSLKCPHEIRTSEDVLKFIQVLKYYHDNFVTTFYSNWHSYSKLGQIIEDLDDIELEKYFTTGAVFRKIIIYKYLDHPDYFRYVNYIQDKFNSLHLNSPEVPYFKNYLSALEEIKTNLN